MEDLFSSEQVEMIKDRGGWCHRNLYAFMVKVPGPVVPDVGASHGMRDVPVEGGAPCVGKYGICQLWDSKRKQCKDVTLLDLQIESAENSIVEFHEKGMGSKNASEKF